MRTLKYKFKYQNFVLKPRKAETLSLLKFNYYMSYNYSCYFSIGKSNRKLRRARQDNQIHISTAIATQQQQQAYQQPQSYGGVNLIKPDGDIYIVPREITPIHSGKFNAPLLLVKSVTVQCLIIIVMY